MPTFAGISEVIDTIVAFIKNAAENLKKFINGLKNEFAGNLPE